MERWKEIVLDGRCKSFGSDVFTRCMRYFLEGGGLTSGKLDIVIFDGIFCNHLFLPRPKFRLFYACLFS